jgi:hypothetical protein
MPAQTLSPKVAAESLVALEKFGTITEAAKALGIPRQTLDTRLQRARAMEVAAKKEIEFTPLPDDDLPVEDLIAHRIKQFSYKQKHEEARKLIGVNVKIDGPIGIWHFGDPHVDDDGTDLAQLREHAKIIRETPGLFGANVGDTTNNWTGRLSHLWAQQSTSAAQAWKLAEWFLKSVDWLYLIGGNHDAWSGAGDPIRWIQRGGSAPYMSSECRLELRFPNGRKCRINARHDFAGHSQWNPTHGPSKALMMGIRDHIAIAGHKHVSGHAVVKDPDSGITSHAFRVASYKIFDRYAREHGFRDQHISPGVFTVIDTRLPDNHPDYITHAWTMEKGLELLKAARE